MYRCGPASVKGIREKIVAAQYDIPFVYAEVNADVCEMIVHNGKILSSKTDTKRVGALICTKRPRSMKMLNITSQYKSETGKRNRREIMVCRHKNNHFYKGNKRIFSFSDERPTPYHSCYSHAQAYSSGKFFQLF